MRKAVAPSLLLLALVPFAYGHDETERAQVFDTDLEVQVGVSRLFLDVEVVDEDGEPVPGLTEDDFSIRVNRRSHPIESVDDLCGCAATEATADPEPQPGLAPSFVLFFDFRQLTPDARSQALAEAERWVREIKRPGDRATISAYSTQADLRRLSPLTDDADRLVEALRAAADDPELIDPFPSELPARLERCISGTTSCHHSAMTEYRHAHRSATALLYYMTRLEALPGRKVLLLFYQNSAIHPVLPYAADKRGVKFLDGRPADSVPHLKSLIDELAGTAVATGTVIHPIVSGVAPEWSIDFGEALAERSGGEHTDSAEEMREGLESAGRGCACMYRIGVDPPAHGRSRVLDVEVAVGGRTLPYDYRVLQLTEQDRWQRSTAAVLLDPEGSDGIELAAAILPVAATAKRWAVKLQVALDARSLTLLPSGSGREAQWEVGAVLVRRQGRDSVEMLGVSRVRCPEDGECAATIVHEREIDDLRPGTYELRAFAHDRWSDAYGGARAVIELPRPKERAVVGPLLLARGDYVSADLPLRKPYRETKGEPAESKGIRASSGAHPLGRAPSGAAVAALSWICGGAKRGGPPETARRLRHGADSVSGLQTTTGERTDRCWSIADSVETARLTPGRYDYELDPAHGGETLRASFEIPATESPPLELEPPVMQASSLVPAPEPVPALPPEPTPAVTVADRVEIRDEPEPLEPSSADLSELLSELALAADRYRDSALRFTCDETIVVNGRDRKALRFEYIYAYGKQGKLLDYRLPRRPGRKVREGKAAPQPVDLAATGLPAFVTRAYLSIFIFERDHQDLYRFEILGEGKALGRAAVKLRFEGEPPHVEDVNDWIGTAWVDLETGQLLLFEGMKAPDRDTKRMFEKGIELAATPAHHRTKFFDEIEVEFGVERAGIRFPSRVVLRRTKFATAWAADYLRTAAREGVSIEQSYENYRFYGVTTEESVTSPIE